MWKSIRYKLQTAGELSRQDWLDLAEALWALLGFSMTLGRVKFDRLEGFARPVGKKGLSRRIP